jgi:hypothetical protein
MKTLTPSLIEHAASSGRRLGTEIRNRSHLGKPIGDSQGGQEDGRFSVVGSERISAIVGHDNQSL